MRTCSVSQTAEMLGVSEETIRRWIRKDDGTLKATRGRGRGGSSLLLTDIVSFANEPPRAYLKSLMSWLDSEGIEYKKIDAPSPDHLNKLMQDAGTTLALTSLGVGMLPAKLFASVGTATFAAMQKKSHVPFTIALVTPSKDLSIEVDFDSENSTETVAEHQLAEVPVCDTTFDETLKSAEAQHNALSKELDIKAKIVEEQIKLIKLKQELAQIQAQISVVEGQIEYYNLLLQKN